MCRENESPPSSCCRAAWTRPRRLPLPIRRNFKATRSACITVSGTRPSFSPRASALPVLARARASNHEGGPRRYRRLGVDRSEGWRCPNNRARAFQRPMCRRETLCCCRSLSAGRKSSVPSTSSSGVNAVDYSGYPDCRPEFIAAFENLAQLATKAGVEGSRFKIHAPLISMSKAEIIRAGLRLGVDYGMTVSCYQADDRGFACGRCDSCRLRAAGFSRGRRAGPDALRMIRRAPHSRCCGRQVRLSYAAQWDGSSVGRARPF
jgi:hypothetical protein